MNYLFILNNYFSLRPDWLHRLDVTPLVFARHSPQYKSLDTSSKRRKTAGPGKQLKSVDDDDSTTRTRRRFYGLIHNDVKFMNIGYKSATRDFSLMDFGLALPAGTREWMPRGADQTAEPEGSLVLLSSDVEASALVAGFLPYPSPGVPYSTFEFGDPRLDTAFG